MLMRRLAIFFAGICFATFTLSADSSRFAGKVVLELIDSIEFDHKLMLVSDFGYQDAQGKLWLVPKGEIIDGYSIPPQLQPLIASPSVAEYRKASVVHDAFSRRKTEPWREVDRMFYAAILTEGLSAGEARLLYMAVYAGGWRWEPRGSSCYKSCHAGAALLSWQPDVTLSELAPVVDWLQQGDPSLEEIEKRVDAAVKRPGPHVFAQVRQ